QASQINRSLDVTEIDPAIYFRKEDPTDPFADFYQKFRDRRAADMANPSRPPDIASFPPSLNTNDKPWDKLENIFHFDWKKLRAQSPEGIAALNKAVKARLALDHPDLKIVQLMIADGGVLPTHADGAPGLYQVVGGHGMITNEGIRTEITPGTTIKLDPYDARRLEASSDALLRILWFRWAPDGDQRYLSAGYYLTGANQHIQPKQSMLPETFQYWGKAHKKPRSVAVIGPSILAENDFLSNQYAALATMRNALGKARSPYPETPAVLQESEIGWLDMETLKKANFFWAKDVRALGDLLVRWGEVMRYKGIFQAKRPGGGWDFNMSQMAWGPYARYVEHSHSIPEFYYMMSGPVEHWVGEHKYIVHPGDIFVTGSFEPHQSRGIVDGMPFRNISGSWAPNGDRSVFTKPAFILESLPEQVVGAVLKADEKFHP
ncbi:hypothetical protein MNBD_ALPHA04-296, partial [hydrothermal vent metagenome]